MSYPTSPRAVIEIQRPGFADGQGEIRWDSWEAKQLFERVEVDLTTNETSQVEWSFFDKDFKVIDAFAGESPVPMSEVRVFLGYGQELGEPIFKGLLADVGRQTESTRFIAFDMGFKMKLVKKAGYKNKKDDLAIIRDLVTRNGLQFEGPETPIKLEAHNAMMQDEATDWEHVLERARDAGLVIYVRHDTLFAKYPAKVGTPVTMLKNRETDSMLLGDWEFNFHTPESQDGRPRVVKVRGRGKAGKRAEGQSDEATRGRERIVLKKDVPGKATKSKLSKQAQAQKELEREHAFEGRVGMLMPADGSRVDVRDTVAIVGVGKLFSGKYICDRAFYRFGPGQLAIELDLYRDIVQ